jgi:hypothetical protein
VLLISFFNNKLVLIFIHELILISINELILIPTNEIVLLSTNELVRCYLCEFFIYVNKNLYREFRKYKNIHTILSL